MWAAITVGFPRRRPSDGSCFSGAGWEQAVGVGISMKPGLDVRWRRKRVAVCTVSQVEKSLLVMGKDTEILK